MSSWKDVTGFSAVKVTRHDGSQTGKIYANGLNQTEIVVYFEPTDEGGHPVTGLTVGDYLGPLQLIDAATEEPLLWNGESNEWSYTDTPNDYYYPVVNSQTTADNDVGKYSIPLYVSCSANATNKSMGVAVRFWFDDKDKTSYSTGDNSQHASKTVVEAKAPLKYSVNYAGQADPNDTIRVARERVYDKDMRSDPAWVDNYTITLNHKDSPNDTILNRRVTQTGSDVNPKYDSYIYAPSYCLYFHHFDDQTHFGYYWFSQNDTEVDNLTIGWTYNEVSKINVDVNTDKKIFNFTVLMIRDTDDHVYMESNTPCYTHCTFNDVYGNPGEFYVWPGRDTSHGDLLNIFYNVANEKP